ncbi:hypothetical protein VHA_002257 [Grimontia hollisae CIP 101886]|uniref:Uncharacterized protein n=1 Tax=Grimontia hollisae CIP 101886 TaxID=675812 RepID=D0I8S0_GRIHO|nr:hypothetical protein VHA_002257 [Grimontia hollisae CIP 101886]
MNGGMNLIASPGLLKNTVQSNLLPERENVTGTCGFFA